MPAKPTIHFLSDDMMTKYRNSHGTKCPFCDSTKLFTGELRQRQLRNGRSKTIPLPSFIQEIICQGCGEVWTNEYDLTTMTRKTVPSMFSVLLGAVEKKAAGA